MGMRQTVQAGVGWMVHGLGMGRGGAAVLMYHSVADERTACYIDPKLRVSPEMFECQMQFLARRRRVVSMSQLSDWMAAGQKISVGTVVITFDDGYIDNLEIAAPILHDLGLPATLYLPTGYVTRGQTQWVDELYSAFAFRRCDRMVCDGKPLDLSRPSEHARAYGWFNRRLIDAGLEQRCQILKEVVSALEPRKRPPRLTLVWDQVRDLVRRYPGFEIGAHTVDHVDLDACDAAKCSGEMIGSVRDIERELGVRPKHFSFPYGRSNRQARQEARRLGFESAVAASKQVPVDAQVSRHQIPRVDPVGSMMRLRCQTHGVDLIKTMTQRA